MTKLHNNYKDVFRSLRLAFSAKKLVMMIWGYILAMVGYVALSYISLLVTGWTFAEIWEAFRLFPIPESLAWYGWLIWVIGVLYALAVLLITGTAVSKVTYEQLKGDDFFQMSKAFKYATGQMKSIIMSPVMIVLFILAVVLTGLVLSLIGAIPYFGEIFTGIMILPAFAASLFIVYLLIILLFTILFAPAIIATTGDDTFDTIFEVFSMINEQPARLIWYSLIAAFLAKAGTLLLGFFSRVAVNIGANILSVFMGGKIFDLIINAASTFKIVIPYWCPEPMAGLTDMFLSWVGGPVLLSTPAYVSGNFAMLLASIIFAIAFYIVVIFVISYGTTAWFTGATCIYAVITKKKDDKDLLETKEEKLTAEAAADTITASK